MNQRIKLNTQPPNERIKNFSEVSLGCTHEQAIKEAERCLNCKTRPCVMGCPVNVRIPEFIDKIKQGNFSEAYNIIKETNSLPAVCGRVCPQESQCESRCVRGIKGEAVSIGVLERFAADYAMKHHKEEAVKAEKNGCKVAVVGSGPASLTCAGDLAKAGFDVTVFEALHRAGGVLIYGIPEFRLPKKIVENEIEKIKELGVKIETNTIIGRTENVSELLEEFDAVFVGTGAGLPSFLGIPGENLNGVYSANELLTRINLMGAYKFPDSDTPIAIGKKVAVVGGGNVAMDAARSAKRFGADVSIIYRRSMEELPARREEVEHAKEEGINFCVLENPTRIIGDENYNVCGIEVLKMQLGEPDEKGRRKPIPIEGSEHVIEVDTVVIAIGQTPNPLIKNTTDGLKTSSRGGIVINEETCETSIPNVYAGGDIVTGAATVILAMGAGKKAAKAIIEKFKK